MSGGLRVCMVLVNFFALAHTIAIGWLVYHGLWPAALAALYLAPPLLARLVRVPDGRYPTSHPYFLRWWASAQFQMLFNRFPLLDEVLRVVPGLYSLWLRFWGSRIGRLTFWAPGVQVLDRGYLEIGDDVVFGTGVRLNGHVLLTNHQGERVLALAAVRIGTGAAVGGYSLLTAGTEIEAGDTTRAHLVSPPFTQWRNGKRIRIIADDQTID